MAPEVRTDRRWSNPSGGPSKRVAAGIRAARRAHFGVTGRDNGPASGCGSGGGERVHGKARRGPSWPNSALQRMLARWEQLGRAQGSGEKKCSRRPASFIFALFSSPHCPCSPSPFPFTGERGEKERGECVANQKSGRNVTCESE